MPLIRNGTGQTSEQCNFEQYNLSFPLTKVSEADLLQDMTGAKVKRDSDDVESSVRLWGASWKQLIDKRTNKTFSGTQLHDALLEILEMLYNQKEIARVNQNKLELEKEQKGVDDGSIQGKKRRSPNFTTVVPYQDKTKEVIDHFPYAFLTFMVLGPPAGDDHCHHFFRRSDDTNMDGSSSKGASNALQSSKRGGGAISRKEARDEQHEERSEVDRDRMKKELVLLQQAEVSALLVCAETDYRKAEMDEITFLENRYGKDSEIVQDKLLAFSQSKRVNKLFDLSNRMSQESSKRSRLDVSSGASTTPSNARLFPSYTPINSSMGQSNSASSITTSVFGGNRSLNASDNNLVSRSEPSFLDNLFLDYSNLNEVFHGRFGYPSAGAWAPKEPVIDLNPVLKFLTDLKKKVSDESVHFFADLWLQKLDPFINSTDSWTKLS